MGNCAHKVQVLIPKAVRDLLQALKSVFNCDQSVILEKWDNLWKTKQLRECKIKQFMELVQQGFRERERAGKESAGHGNLRGLNKLKNKETYKQAVWINLLYWNDFTDWNEKNYRIWFLPTSGISSCGISQGKIISVNWLLCYRFFRHIVCLVHYN